MKPFAALVAAVGLLLPADKADDPSTKDLDKLQGTWTLMSAQAGGKDVPAYLLAVEGMAFDRDTYTNIVKGQPTTSGAFRAGRLQAAAHDRPRKPGRQDGDAGNLPARRRHAEHGLRKRGREPAGGAGFQTEFQLDRPQAEAQKK